MTKTKDGATIMREAADKAAEAGYQAIIADIEANDTLDNDRRKIGATVTAVTQLYGSVVEALLEHAGETEISLAHGMFEIGVAPVITKLIAAKEKLK